MLELAGEKLDAVTGEVVGKAYAGGDALAREVLREGADRLAVWLSNMIDLLDPEVIVIGGGASALYQPFLGAWREHVPKLTVNPRAREVTIVAAHYGAEAGIAGGAALCT